MLSRADSNPPDLNLIYRKYPEPADDLASNYHSLPYASQFLGMSQDKLWRLCMKGDGPRCLMVQKGSRTYYRFRMADLMDYRKTMWGAV